MTVTKLFIVDDYTSLGIRRNVVIASWHSAGFVYTREEGFDRVTDGIRAAKGTDSTGLGERISLPLSVSLYKRLLATGYWPFGNIAPVCVLGQNRIRCEQISGDLPKHELSVRRGGGPVHESRRLVGRIIKLLNTDLFSHLTGDGDVFVGCDFSCQRDDKP